MLMAKKIVDEKWVAEYIDFEHRGDEHIFTGFELNNNGRSDHNVIYSVFCDKYRDNEEANRFNLYCYENKKLIGTKKMSLEGNPILDNAHSLINAFVMDKAMRGLSD
jgi:hypothetical protein